MCYDGDEMGWMANITRLAADGLRRILGLRGGEQPSIEIMDSENVIVADNVHESDRPFLAVRGATGVTIWRNVITRRGPIALGLAAILAAVAVAAMKLLL